MVLSDGEIWEALEKGEIVLDPFPEDRELVQPSSLDLRLGPTLLLHSDEPIPGVSIDPQSSGDSGYRQYCRRIRIGYIDTLTKGAVKAFHPHPNLPPSMGEGVILSLDLLGCISSL